MIDTKTIYNLIAQNLVKAYNIFGNNKVLFFTGANGGKIRFFKHHYVAIEAYGHNSS